MQKNLDFFPTYGASKYRAFQCCNNNWGGCGWWSRGGGGGEGLWGWYEPRPLGQTPGPDPYIVYIENKELGLCSNGRPYIFTLTRRDDLFQIMHVSR